ncbi:MAG: class I SAM-dependent methyltransferase [Chloroflexi bacterium]|nr:class I SAM-dependent methyltransferase [Chloroflexota bacterium]
MPDLHSPEYDELAEYFDLLNEKYAPYEQECDFVDQALQHHGKQGRAVLDLACGTGIHAIRLAQRGYVVTGVDLSPAMLAIARRKAAVAGLPITFVQADMKALSFHEQFDVALAVNYPVTFCVTEDDLQRFLHGVHAALRPGGVLLVDFLSVYGSKTSTSREWVEGEGPHGDRVRIECVREWSYDRARQVAMDKMIYFVERDGGITRFDGYHEWRIFYPQEMLAYLRRLGGFNILGLYRCWSLDGAPSGPNDVIIAEKPSSYASGRTRQVSTAG